MIADSKIVQTTETLDTMTLHYLLGSKNTINETMDK